MNPRKFWLGHMLAPSLLTLLAFVLLRVWRLDERLALLFFDGQYWPFKENWWLREFMHTGGHRLALAAFLALGLLVLGRHWCRHAGASASRGPGLAYGLAAISISVGVIAMGKALLRFPCPWDLVNHPGPFLAYTWLPDAAGCVFIMWPAPITRPCASLPPPLRWLLACVLAPLNSCAAHIF